MLIVKLFFSLMMVSLFSLVGFILSAQIAQEQGREDLYFKLGSIAVWSWRALAVSTLFMIAAFFAA